MRRFLTRIANLFRGKTAEREMAREMEAHLSLLEEQFESCGLTGVEAKLAARRAYGGVEQAKELHREARSVLWMDHFAKDIRYGCRNLLRTPGFTVVAVMTLALGIGANTAIFGVVNAVLLRPLAYRDADRLVTVLHNGVAPVATANYIDWRDQSHSFAALGAADYWTPNLTTYKAGNNNPAEHLFGLKVTQNLLPLLGVEPSLGRLFAQGEDREGSDHEVILSDALWRRRFDSDRNILGRPIALNGEAYTVVGVMPPAFKFAPFWATHAELWVPDALGETVHERHGNHLRVFGRLKPGSTLQQAKADMATVTGRLETLYPASNRNVVVRPLKENVLGNMETPLFLLLGAVGFVLLIACANVAHMLLARTADRQKEIAVRVAMGAGKARVMAQFLTESVVLAAAGSVVGLAFAWAGTRALVRLSAEYIPRVEMVGIDAQALLFLMAVTLLTALVFGLVPAMHASAGNLSDALKEGGRGGSGGGLGRSGLRNALVASEFAVAFLLLIGAGLMVRSFYALQAIDPGFNPHGVLSMEISVAGTAEEKPERRTAFYRELLEKVRALPGVAAVGGINHLPLAGDQWDRSFAIEGRPKSRPGQSPGAVYRIVMPGYFETMRLPLRSGHAFSLRDDTRSRGVVVLNERAARDYWPNESPVGKRISFGNGSAGDDWLTVVGVVANAMEGEWSANPWPEMYLPALQTPNFLGFGAVPEAAHMNYLTLVVRGADNAGVSASAVRQAVWSFDRNLPISHVQTMDEVVANATAQPRFEMLLLALFGVAALVLAGVGIYGVINYSLSRRTREIGVRISLGATRGDVVRMVMRQAVGQAAAGTLAGIAGAMLLSKLMTKMLYGVTPTDPWTFAAVTVVLGMAAMLATGVPARRATRIELMKALRSE